MEKMFQTKNHVLWDKEDKGVSFLHCKKKDKKTQIGPPCNTLDYCPFCCTHVWSEYKREKKTRKLTGHVI